MAHWKGSSPRFIRCAPGSKQRYAKRVQDDFKLSWEDSKAMAVLNCDGGGGDPAYVTTGKYIEGYDPEYQMYSRPDMWPSDNGSLFTFAAFLRIPDQPSYLNNRMLLSGQDDWTTLILREWDNYTDAGGNTNRFLSYVQNVAADGYSGFGLSNSVHGISASEWFAYMFSIDYSGAAPVVRHWVHRKGDATGFDVVGLELDAATGQIVFDWDDTSIVTSVGMHPNQHTNQGNYDISAIYITNEAVDWSVEANRLKFVDTAGKPVDMGSNGSLLTGTQPKHYAPDGDLSNNRGTESNWTASGTISDSSTSPTD